LLVENATVLAVMARPLPEYLRSRALRHGIAEITGSLTQRAVWNLASAMDARVRKRRATLA